MELERQELKDRRELYADAINEKKHHINIIKEQQDEINELRAEVYKLKPKIQIQPLNLKEKMDFIYNSELVSTQDEIKITIADLRDLIQASGLMKENEEQGINEYRL